MPVVPIDKRGRTTFLHKTGIRGRKAVLIPMGSTYTSVPIPEDPEKYAQEWLDTDKERKELKELVQRVGKRKAKRKAQRRDRI